MSEKKTKKPLFSEFFELITVTYFFVHITYKVMNNNVLALRNRTFQINTENITNIRITQTANHLNSTTISEACLTKNFSFIERLQILKAELLNQSSELHRAILGSHNSMAYEFSIKQAMLCIP